MIRGRLTRVLLAALMLLESCAFTPPHRMENRLFLDTADTAEWRSLLPTGMKFHGVTCNPTLLERANETCTVSNLHKLAAEALAYTNEFMCQSWGSDSQEMYDNGMKISEPDRDKIVIKVPVTKEGTVAATQLQKSGVRICLTACYGSKQALVAAGMGVEYIAPYLGRMTDNGKNGFDECVKMQQIVDGLQADTRILAASIRDAESLADLAVEGLDTFTFSPDVARQLFDEPLTLSAAEEFEKAAARGSQTL